MIFWRDQMSIGNASIEDQRRCLSSLINCIEVALAPLLRKHPRN